MIPYSWLNGIMLVYYDNNAQVLTGTLTDGETTDTVSMVKTNTTTTDYPSKWGLHNILPVKNIDTKGSMYTITATFSLVDGDGNVKTFTSQNQLLKTYFKAYSNTANTSTVSGTTTKTVKLTGGCGVRESAIGIVYPVTGVNRIKLDSIFVPQNEFVELIPSTNLGYAYTTNFQILIGNAIPTDWKIGYVDDYTIELSSSDPNTLSDFIFHMYWMKADGTACNDFVNQSIVNCDSFVPIEIESVTMKYDGVYRIKFKTAWPTENKFTIFRVQYDENRYYKWVPIDTFVSKPTSLRINGTLTCDKGFPEGYYGRVEFTISTLGIIANAQADDRYRYHDTLRYTEYYEDENGEVVDIKSVSITPNSVRAYVPVYIPIRGYTIIEDLPAGYILSGNIDRAPINGLHIIIRKIQQCH